MHAILWELGLFQLLEQRPNMLPVRAGPDHIAVIPLMRSARQDKQKIARLSDGLADFAEVLSQDPLMYGAMVEAAANCVDHAYPRDFSYEYPPLRYWWAAASYDLNTIEVRVVVYDQGVGIAATLPASEVWERVVALVSSVLGVGQFLNEHSTMIAAALEVTRTSRGDWTGRGYGLHDIVMPIEETGCGSVSILSGKGEILYEPGQKITKTEHGTHLGGTLIEWVVPLGKSVSHGKREEN